MGVHNRKDTNKTRINHHQIHLGCFEVKHNLIDICFLSDITTKLKQKYVKWLFVKSRTKDFLQ